VITRVAHYSIRAHEHGEVASVYADGGLEIEIIDRPDRLLEMRLGPLARRPPFARRRAERFLPDEVARPGERI
jgi:hypothetical protein